MKIIHRGRGQGKTTQLLYTSDTTRVPILTHSIQGKQFLIQQSVTLGLNIPEPIVANEYMELLHGERPERIYIDNAEMVLRSLLECIVDAIVVNIDEEKVKYTLRPGKINQNIRTEEIIECPHYTPDNIPKNIRNLRQYHNKSSQEIAEILNARESNNK